MFPEPVSDRRDVDDSVIFERSVEEISNDLQDTPFYQAFNYSKN